MFGFINSMVGGYVDYKKKNPSRWEYDHLGDTPFLNSSKHLRNMFYASESNEEKLNILNHMARHKVVQEEYKGYWSLSRQIQNALEDDDNE